MKLFTGKNGIWHLMALVTAAIWGTTFVSTKVLIAQGLSPADILFYRFLLAYLVMWFFSPRILFAHSLKDELLMVGAGLAGGSLYFIAENTALGITLASNVSLIICTTPVFTAILSHFWVKGEKLKRGLLYGSLIALGGVALVVFNGSFILQINPLGDFLTITAALMWAFYNIILKRLDSRYSTLLITRKVFFYGVITLLPVFLLNPLTTDTTILLKPVVIGNLIFLGLVASMLCYIMWNVAVKQLGPTRTSNYLYIIPLVTLLTSSVVIGETITVIALTGAVLILCGVYLAEKGWKREKAANH